MFYSSWFMDEDEHLESLQLQLMVLFIVINLSVISLLIRLLFCLFNVTNSQFLRVMSLNSPKPEDF